MVSSEIQSLEYCEPLQAHRATLSCGHQLFLAHSWSVGMLRYCEACARKDPKVVSVSAREGKSTLYLSCGDTFDISHDDEHITPEITQLFIGTAHPCKPCQERKPS
jgi:hypothetical protein